MTAINFSVKEKISPYFVPSDTNASKKSVLIGTILSGGFSGSLAVFCLFPLDYARTRLATDVKNKTSSKR